MLTVVAAAIAGAAQLAIKWMLRVVVVVVVDGEYLIIELCIRVAKIHSSDIGNLFAALISNQYTLFAWPWLGTGVFFH